MRGACVIVLIAGLHAAAVGAAESLHELLEQTAASQSIGAAETAARAARYASASPEARAELVTAAEAARSAAEAASTAALATYNANELKLGEMNRTLAERLASGGLGEVVGLARQVAGDVATVTQQSMTTAEIAARDPADDRVTALRAMAAADEVPDTATLERLWQEMLREMTLSGQVARFKARIAEPDGSRVEREVVRVGPFTASAGGDYLEFAPSLASFLRMSRQPPNDLRKMARDLAASREGYVQAAVDPGRGALLAIYVERPDWRERVHLGGEVTYVILVVGALGLVLWALQFLYLVWVRVAVFLQMRDLTKLSKWNALGRVLSAFKGEAARIEEDADIAELRISEAVLREVPKLERCQAFLRLAVAAGPLLGLIGTVIGMIITFQAITESGSSDPKLMAAGIGQAMIATVAGLGIAIPLLFGNAILASLSRGVVQVLDEQSTGLLAETLERQRRA